MELKTSKWEASMFNIFGEVQKYSAWWVLGKIHYSFSVLPQENATKWLKKEKKKKIMLSKTKKFWFWLKIRNRLKS